MDEDRRAFYEYHAALMEPWDGPAAMAFTDGRQIGATLDRNGLRPARYIVTDDDYVVMASEVGVLDIPERKIVRKWRLQPGKMLLVDLEAGRIIDDDELKRGIATQKPYRDWIDESPHRARRHARARTGRGPIGGALLDRQQAFGYTQEDLKVILAPMAQDGEEAIGSMGNDAALAVLSNRPKVLYNYFKQLFAQVTNPPIDPIREELVMSLIVVHRAAAEPAGLDENRSADAPGGAAADPHRRRTWRSSVTSNSSPAARSAPRSWTSATRPHGEPTAWKRALAVVVRACGRCDQQGPQHPHPLRPQRAAPSACRSPRCWPQRPCINIWCRWVCAPAPDWWSRPDRRAKCTISRCSQAMAPRRSIPISRWKPSRSCKELIPEVDARESQKHFVKAICKGLMKVMSKMGISTYQSYCGAQIFEAVGLQKAFVDKYFTGTASNIEGIGLFEVAEETERTHALAFGDDPVLAEMLDAGGEYQYRVRGEEHMWTPDSIAKLQHATRTNSPATFREYSALIDDQGAQAEDAARPVRVQDGGPHAGAAGGSRAGEGDRQAFRLGCHEPGFDFHRSAHDAGGGDEPHWRQVQYRRRRRGFPALSRGNAAGQAPAKDGDTLATFIGKENVAHDFPLKAGDSLRSRIKQVASGRFGVTAEYLASADQLQIKMAQGAKPGEGGQLPGHKVSDYIARAAVLGARRRPDLATAAPRYLLDRRPGATDSRLEERQSAGIDLGEARVRSRRRYGGGGRGQGQGRPRHHRRSRWRNGASPVSSIKHAGTPWELGLAETQQTLVLNRLRGRIVVQVDGQMKTGRDVAIGALLGADEFGFATAPLVVEGCIMMRKCHLNTCPVGIATQDPVLRKRFDGQPEHVVNYFFFVAEELRAIMAELGFRNSTR